MLKQRADQTTSQTKRNQNIDIDLQLSLLNVWMQYNVAGYYQNIVLAHLDQLQPQEAEKFIQKEIKLTEQKKSPYFQLTKILKQRNQALQKLRSLVQSRQQDQILAKMPKICDKIKQLRESNLLTAEQILKMYQIYHCTQIEYTDKQMEFYSSILNSLHKDNQFMRKSPLNKELKLSNDYDPFLMSPYEKIYRNQDQQIDPSIKQLFSLNFSQVHRLIKVKKLVEDLFSITKTKGKQKEQSTITSEKKQQPKPTPENKQLLTHKRRYSRQSEDIQRMKHNEDDEIQLPRINNTPKNQQNIRQPKRLMRSSIYNHKETDRIASIERDSKLRPKITRTNNQSLLSGRNSKTEKKLKLQTGKIQNFKTQHYEKNKDLRETDLFNVDIDDNAVQKRQSAPQIKEKIKMIGTKKLDLGQILKGRRLTPLKRDSLKESETRDDQIQQQEIEQDSNVGLMTQVPLKRYNNKRRRQKDKLVLSHRYQQQLKKNLSAQKGQDQIDIQIQQQAQKEIPRKKNTPIEDKDQDSENVRKTKNNEKDDRQQVAAKQKEKLPQNKQKKVAQNSLNTERKGSKAQKQLQKQKVSDKAIQNKKQTKDNQVKTQQKNQSESPNPKKPKGRQLVDRKEDLSIKQKQQNQPIKDNNKSTNNTKPQESQKIVQKNKAQSLPIQNQRTKKGIVALKDEKQPLNRQTQNEKMKSNDDKLSITISKDNSPPPEKKKTTTLNQTESDNKPTNKKIEDDKNQNERANPLKNKSEDHKQTSKEPQVKSNQKIVKVQINQRQREVQKQRIKQTQKTKQKQTNSSTSQQGQKIVAQKKEILDNTKQLEKGSIVSKQPEQKQRQTTKQTQKAPIVNRQSEDKQKQPSKQVQKIPITNKNKETIKIQPSKQIQKVPSTNKEKEKETLKIQTSKQMQKLPTTNKEKETIKIQKSKQIDKTPVISKEKENSKQPSKQMPKESTSGEQKNKYPSQTSPSKQKQEKKIEPLKQMDKAPQESKQKQEKQSQLPKVIPKNKQSEPKNKQDQLKNKQTQVKQKQTTKQLQKAQPQKQIIKKQISSQAPKINKTSTDKQQQLKDVQNKQVLKKQNIQQNPNSSTQKVQKPGEDSKNMSKQPEQSKNKSESPKQQIVKEQKPQQASYPPSKKQDGKKPQKQEKLSSKDVSKPSIQAKPQNLKEKNGNTQVNKKSNENEATKKEPEKSQQKVQKENPKNDSKPVPITKENQKEPHQQNVQNQQQQQIEPRRKPSSENIKQQRQVEEELPAVQNIIFQPIDSQQEQQVPKENEEETKPKDKPQQQKQQSKKNTSPLIDSQPLKQQSKQNNPQKAPQKSQQKDQQKKQESKDQQKDRKYKHIKMKTGKSTVQEMTEILNKMTLPQQYKPCFDIKSLISWIKVSQTYLTRFTIQDQDVLICLCSPVVNKALALMLWAPISPKVNLDISSHQFKKYMELIQKYTTSSKIAFSGKPFKQLEAEQFIRKKQNLYQRPRKNDPVIEQQEFQSFLYIECSNIKLQNKTNDKILYSQQIQPFKAQNCYCANFITEVNSQQIPSPLKSLLKHTANVDNFAKVDQVLKQQKFDGYDAKNVQITNIDLIRFYLNSYLKTPFLAQDFYFKFFGYSLYQKGKECIVCVSLVKHNGFIYFAKNLPFPKVLQIIKSSSINQKKQKFFNVMMFNKKLFGKMPNNSGCYGNWEINLLWEDELQGNIKHDMKQAISFGPENFKVVIQLEKVVILGFQVSKND